MPVGNDVAFAVTSMLVPELKLMMLLPWLEAVSQAPPQLEVVKVMLMLIGLVLPVVMAEEIDAAAPDAAARLMGFTLDVSVVLPPPPPVALL